MSVIKSISIFVLTGLFLKVCGVASSDCTDVTINYAGIEPTVDCHSSCAHPAAVWHYGVIYKTLPTLSTDYGLMVKIDYRGAGPYCTLVASVTPSPCLSAMVSGSKPFTIVTSTSVDKITTPGTIFPTTTKPITTTEQPTTSKPVDCDSEIVISHLSVDYWTTPNYPHNYPEGIVCTLKITIPATMSMGVASATFESPSEIRAMPGCTVDRLEYISSVGATSRYCGPLAGGMTSELTMFDAPKTFILQFTSMAGDGGAAMGVKIAVTGVDQLMG